MQVTMIIPSYWGRKKEEKRRETDTIYDHPTSLDDEGTLGRLLESLSILTKRDFRVVVLAVPTAEDIQSDVEQKVSTIIKEKAEDIETQLFSYSHLAKIHQFLTKNNKADLTPLLKLNGYSNVRNLCIFVPHLLGSEIAVLIDDDEIFEDPSFMDKALELIERKNMVKEC